MSGQTPFETMRGEIVETLEQYRAEIIHNAGGAVTYDREGNPHFPRESIGNSFKRMIGYSSGKEGLMRANALLDGENNLSIATDLRAFFGDF